MNIIDNAREVLEKYFYRLKQLSSFQLNFGLIRKYLRFISKAVQILAAIIIAVLGITSGIIALQNYDEFSKWANKTFRTEAYWIQIAESLGPEMNGDIFDEKLGIPIFTNTLDGLTNKTYINDFFYTQAIIEDLSNNVVLYSITSRKESFNPRIPYVVDDNKEYFKLGEVTYEQFGNRASLVGAQYAPGARRFIYSEIYYIGNPGNYLYYGLTTNDAGFNNIGDIGDEKAVSLKETGFFDGCNSEFLSRPGFTNDENDELNRVMGGGFESARQSKANTITISERHGSLFCDYPHFRDSDMLILGPNLDKVRLIPFYLDKSSRS